MVPAELIQWVGNAGAVAAPIFLFLWWDERGQRITCQTKVEALAERMLVSAGEVKALLQTVVDIFNGSRKT